MANDQDLAPEPFFRLRRPGGRALTKGIGVLLSIVALFVPELIGASHAADSGDAAAGKLKARACVNCHGLDGIAIIPNAPNLAGESDLYITAQLRRFRSGARQHEQMSIIAAGLSDQDINDLAAWFSHIEVTTRLPDLD